MAERAGLQEFVAAQDRVWGDVCAELAAGRKRGHWMWFVFPQLASLGWSGTAKRYGLAGLGDARAYLADPVLGPRLVEAAALLLAHSGADPVSIMGPVDAMKLRSSMSLFEAADPSEPAFSAVLETLCAGERCALTKRAITA